MLIQVGLTKNLLVLILMNISSYNLSDKKRNNVRLNIKVIKHNPTRLASLRLWNADIKLHDNHIKSPSFKDNNFYQHEKPHIN